jgi:hypothetical protein
LPGDIFRKQIQQTLGVATLEVSLGLQHDCGVLLWRTGRFIS